MALKTYDEYKDSGVGWIGEIPEHWSVKRIKQISKIFGRIGFRGYTVADLVDEGDGPITIGPPNIENQKLNWDKKTFISWEKYEESPEIKIFENDILFVKTASVGKVAYVDKLDGFATINPQLVVFKNISINNKYFYYCLISSMLQNQINADLQGGVVATLTQENIKNYFLTIPDIYSQTKIVDYLDNEVSKITKIISKIQQNINLLEEYKNSLIHHVVTGKVDVRGETV